MNLLHGRIASLRYTRSFAYRINMFQLLRSVRVALAQLISISPGIQRNLVHNGSNTGVLQLP